MTRSHRPNGPIARVIAGVAAITGLAALAGGVWMAVASSDLRLIGIVLAALGLVCAVPFGYVALTGREPSPPSLWP